MNNHLLRQLINRNIIKPTTEIDARYKGLDIAGAAIVNACDTFLILEIDDRGDDGVYFKTANIIDGHRRSLASSDIVRVDGMELDRLAGIYGMNIEGLPMRQAKRRGRKPRQDISLEENTF